MKYKVRFDLELNKNPYKGLYVALEGIDGSGKTTQAKNLAAYFKGQGREVVVTQEPSRTGAVGKLVHEVLQSKVKIPKIAIQYLFSADRAIHQEELIIPSLKKGKIVISDRAFWSGVGYGILDKGGVKNAIDASNQLMVALSILSNYHQFVAPDETIYLDVPVTVAIDRITHMNRKAELYEKSELLEKVKEIYEWMVKEFKGAFTSVDGSKNEKEITKEIIEQLEKIDKFAI